MNRAILQLGRLLIALIFLYSGYHKATDIGGTVERLANKGLPAPEVLAVVATGLEILGALMVGLGFRPGVGAFLLILFLVPTTLVFHSPTEKAQITQFLKNVAILGGLVVLVATADQRDRDD